MMSFNSIMLWVAGAAIFAAGYGLGYMKGSLAELQNIVRDIKELNRDS